MREYHVTHQEKKGRYYYTVHDFSVNAETDLSALTQAFTELLLPEYPIDHYVIEEGIASYRKEHGIDEESIAMTSPVATFTKKEQGTYFMEVVMEVKTSIYAIEG